MNIGITDLANNTTLLYGGENEWDLKIGDVVIFSHGERAECAGRVAFFDRPKVTTETILNGKIIRSATKVDEKKIREQAKKADEALEKCRAKVTELKLPMFVLSATYTFDESEVNFAFAAEERVDFRELVPALAGMFRKRVHLQQIGARDRAKATGGVGICGREYCCTGALTQFRSITMDMARTQELAMKGAPKLSGACGKLLCCLSYEVEEYEKLRKGMPYYSARVKTEKGLGKVIGLDILNQRVKIYLDVGGVQIMPASEVTVIKKSETMVVKNKE